MKALFLGGLFPKDHEDDIYRNSKGIIQTAANQLQWNLIEGLEAVMHQGIDIITSVFIGSYPDLYTKIYHKAYSFSRRKDTDNLAIGFINVKGLEIYHKLTKLYRPVMKWIKSNENSKEKLVIFVYSAQPQFLYTVKRIKTEYKDVRICLIVPDLPEYMTVNDKKTLLRYIYNRFMKDGLRRIVYDNIKYVDSFVILTEHMKEPLMINDRPYVVVEGVAGVYADDENPERISTGSFIDIVYTGTLARKYGIVDLVLEFMKIKDNRYRLVICGEGDSRREIESLAIKDPRVIFKGPREHKEVLKIQRQAALLVNPRKNDEEYTRYSFPSKTMEYMLSGRPVLMFRLDGIPREYDEYLYYFDDWPKSSMAEVITEICEAMPGKPDELGEKAKRYVLENKSPEKQSKKILDMVCGFLNKQKKSEIE